MNPTLAVLADCTTFAIFGCVDRPDIELTDPCQPAAARDDAAYSARDAHVERDRAPGGRLKCWGMNQRGKLGQQVDTEWIDTPGEIAPIGVGGRWVITASSGGNSVSALLDGGQVNSWGGAMGLGLDWGQGTWSVGDAPSEMDTALHAVNLGHVAVQLCQGGCYTCASLEGGQVKCWGLSAVGALGRRAVNEIVGDATGEMGGQPPFVDLGGTRALSVPCGSYHTCAYLVDDTSKCWGGNWDAQLGRAGTAPASLRLVDDEGEAPAALDPIRLQ